MNTESNVSHSFKTHEFSEFRINKKLRFIMSDYLSKGLTANCFGLYHISEWSCSFWGLHLQKIYITAKYHQNRDYHLRSLCHFLTQEEIAVHQKGDRQLKHLIPSFHWSWINLFDIIDHSDMSAYFSGIPAMWSYSNAELSQNPAVCMIFLTVYLIGNCHLLPNQMWFKGHLKTDVII